MGVARERREAMKERDGLSDGRATGTWVVGRGFEILSSDILKF